MSIVNYASSKMFPTGETKFLVELLNLSQLFGCKRPSMAERGQFCTAFQKLCHDSDEIMPKIRWHQRSILAQRVGLAGTIFIADYYERLYCEYQAELMYLCDEIKHDLIWAQRKKSAHSKKKQNRNIGTLETLLLQCERYLALFDQSEHRLFEQKRNLMQNIIMRDAKACEDAFIDGGIKIEHIRNICAAAMSDMKLSELLNHYPQCQYFINELTPIITYQDYQRTMLADIYAENRCLDCENGR